MVREILLYIIQQLRDGCDGERVSAGGKVNDATLDR